MTKIAVFLTATAALAAAASAGTVDYTDFSIGTMGNSFVRDGVTVTVAGFDNVFRTKDAGTGVGAYKRLTGVGIQQGDSGNEIDNGLHSQWIRIEFSSRVDIQSLSIGMLYSRGNFNDVIDETAAFVVNDPFAPPPHITSTTATFTATGLTSGTMAGAFSATAGYVNDSYSIDGVHNGNIQGGGGWNISDASNIFRWNTHVTSIYFLPQIARDANGNEIDGGQYSDFVFRNLTFTAVPTPMAATIGFVGLGLVARRRRLA